ncbi:DUF2750 domain-containing protein [Chryseobacterium lactis]|uniref:DUF2750 domain-containing protein n=1 Tax=Chryseobacterium lactis TaxID=1241981 RepID=A0A3G6RJB5_CHRLC|nr:DUF2750 domain-containing protein [Chryseobacterium lactis]AZA83922.1 DUF2750 domain-containing protein [Chryseobacterium lactis]AZB04308.1 DUF2750 domain-containing protein [Chryseobacterium lactis]PNW12780.1 DUF2750 domain-containing protein [Chryseobacterium lactis]
MLQDHITVKNRHIYFIKKVSTTEIVYALRGEKGYATSCSNDLQYGDGEPVEIVCFWSDNATAKLCIQEEWNHYEVCSIPLEEFMENWCIGMDNDGLIAGTNFDNNLFGYEVEPLELCLDLIRELKNLGKSLRLKKFADIHEMETQIRKILEE